jgi:hypothetical protein
MMKTTASITPGVQALAITVTGKNRILHAIVTREMLEHLYGDIGKSQESLLGTFDEHASALEVLIVAEYRKRAKGPVLLHFPRSGASEPVCRAGL